MTFEEAVKVGKVVVVAGAGISKDPPANLPSWWDYNMILLECIGEMGAKALGSSQNLLNMEIVKREISVTNVSEFFVDRIAGEHYYPLLSMLDGAQPNVHHLMLAQLFDLGIIRAIVTTNFDTLIEKAFKQKKISLSTYNSPEDYYQEKDENSCALYKIHGSADKPEFAIDTIHQKYKGLSVEKIQIMQKLFAENHILFVGFSGEDFLFGSDYIPVSANKNNNFGITWIAHPGSVFNENTQRLIKELNIDVRQQKLPDFYRSQGWTLPKANYTTNSNNETFIEIARKKVFELLTRIGEWACLGMCIELLDLSGEHSKADDIVLKIHNHNVVNIMEMPQKISLYTSLAVHAMSRNNPKEALNYCDIQIQTFKFLDENMNQMTSKTYRAMSLNKSTVANRKGMILFEPYKKYAEAREYFLGAFYFSYEAHSWENMAVSLSNLAMLEFAIWLEENGQSEPHQPHFIAIMEAAQRIAEHGGYAEVVFGISCHLVQMYVAFGQKKPIERNLKKAELLKDLCIKKEANNTLLNNSREIAQLYTEMPPWPNDEVPLCPPYDTRFIWDPFGQRPVLAYEEGKKAKKLYEGGQIQESVKYLLDSAEEYLEQKQYEMADILFDCAAGIFLSSANDAAIQKKTIFQNKNLINGRSCYEKCLISEMFMGRIDYLVGTLGSLSKLNSVISDSADKELAVFQAELALCICNDPNECWQSVLAAETACKVNLEKGLKNRAEKYGKMYFDMVNAAPWAAHPINIAQMAKLLKECQSSI